MQSELPGASQPYIFVSYASADRERVLRVAGALREGDCFGEVFEGVARLAKTDDVVRLVRHGCSPWDEVIERAHQAASRTSDAGSAT